MPAPLNMLTFPLAVIRPIDEPWKPRPDRAGVPSLVNHSAPPGPTVIPAGWSMPAPVKVVKAPEAVTRPIELLPPLVNHTAPPGPLTSCSGRSVPANNENTGLVAAAAPATPAVANTSTEAIRATHADLRSTAPLTYHMPLAPWRSCHLELDQHPEHPATPGSADPAPRLVAKGGHPGFAFARMAAVASTQLLQTYSVARLVRDSVALAYDQAGGGSPPLVFVHGAACNRRFWDRHVRHFAFAHRVIAVDLRGHGESDAPMQSYAIRGFTDDLAWTCAQLGIEKPVVVGHSLGGLIALDFASAYPDRVDAAVLIDSLLLPGGDRADVVRDLVERLRGNDPDSALRGYFASLFGRDDDPALRSWIVDQAVKTPPHVSSSLWEESLVSWDDEAALRCCWAPLLYLDAGTPNADLKRAVELCPGLTIGRTIGSGHFSPIMVPDQVNAMLERFLTIVSTR